MILNSKHLTIKRLLLFVAGLTSFILLALGIITGIYIQHTSKEYAVISTIKDLQEAELRIRKSEKDFLVYETSNPEFFQTGQSQYLETIKTDLEQIASKLLWLKQNKTISDLHFENDIEKLNELFLQYNNLTDRMVKLVLKKGFKDFGIEGDMRAQIHNVESEVQKANNKEFEIFMLTLRRHEKDYLLRHDLTYLEKFEKVKGAFVDRIKTSGQQFAYLEPILDKYSELFHQLVSTDVEIGLTSQTGLRLMMNQCISEIESDLLVVSKQVEAKSHKKINVITFNLLAITALFSVLIVLLILYASRHIVRSIADLRRYITRLGHGELPDEIPIYNKDEIAHMKESINLLTYNLKNTKEFAEAVGNGNFEKEINVFGNEGDLGSALLDMRQKLLQIAKERENQLKEAEQRNWANQGFNQVHGILTSEQDEEESFYYQIISKLTKYLGANQGTIFVLADRFGEAVLIQKGTYAFDRRKINQKEIKIGEGIVGAVAFEKQTTYHTHLPKDYINITSGLGDAPPSFLLIVPCLNDDQLLGIIEIASFFPIEDYKIKFVEQVASDIANNIRRINVNETTRTLLVKTQEQARELSEKEEAMRQNLEELKATQEAMQARERELLIQIEHLEKQIFSLGHEPKPVAVAMN